MDPWLLPEHRARNFSLALTRSHFLHPAAAAILEKVGRPNLKLQLVSAALSPWGIGHSIWRAADRAQGQTALLQQPQKAPQGRPRGCGLIVSF